MGLLRYRNLLVLLLSVCSLGWALSLRAQPIDHEPKAVVEAMELASDFYQTRLAKDGLYVWAYSSDGLVRRGEGGEVEANVGWIQPPGSPAIGAAYLRLFEVTGNKVWLVSAQEIAHSLISVQLKSGGWYYHAETDEHGRKNWCYASNVGQDCDAIQDKKEKNNTVLDDNTTQSVIGFLIWFDEASNQSDERIRKAINYSLSNLMDLQYANGSFPVYSNWKKGRDEVDPTLKATPPDDEWSRVWVKPDDPPYFVTNDNIVLDAIRVLLYADRVYGCKRCVKSAVQAGEFLLLAQLPDPMPGWAQTYDKKMQPAWGRKFEPPSVASWETVGAIEALILLYQHVADERFLLAARRGLAWLGQSQLSDGLWARFYEIATSRPLYINSKYELTYADHDLLDHYVLKSDFGFSDKILQAEKSIGGGNKLFRYWQHKSDFWTDEQLATFVKSKMSTQDSIGRWLENGEIRSASFVDAIFAMSKFVEQHKSD